MDSNTPTLSSDQGRFYVYVHCRADDGEPFYAGKGSGKRAWAKTGRSDWWKRIVAKHGLVVKIQRSFQDESEAFASEIETIAILRDLGHPLVNLTEGGEGASGAVRSAETRAKIAERTRQQMASGEARAAQAERARQQWADPEACQAMAKKISATKSTPEARAAQAERARQQWSSPEARQAQSERMSGESSPAAKLSDEACRQMFHLRSQGLSQAKIAAYLGCDQAQVSYILRGKSRPYIYLEFHPEQAYPIPSIHP